MSTSTEIIDKVRDICSIVCEDDLCRLRMEEELLITAVKNQLLPLKDKIEVFDRIKSINLLQLEMLGQRVRR